MKIQNQVLSLTKRLARFKTTSDRLGELKKCIDFVERYFSSSDFVVKRFSSNEKPSLVVLFKETKKPELFLVAHLDVVPADDEMFKPVVKKNRLIGRGVFDDKASAAIIMTLMKEYAKTKPNIGLMLTTDEEVGGRNGTKYLIKKKGYSARFCVVLDAGKDYNVVTEEKGALHIKIIAKGKDGHGSTPWKGKNAIDTLIDFYHKLRRSFPATTKQNRWKKTINLGKLVGGTAVNKIPDYAEMELDMRFISEKEKKDIINKIKKAKKIKYEILSDAKKLYTDQNNKYVIAFRDSVNKVMKKRAKFSLEHGATDARYFSSKGIPSVLILPQGGNVHAKGECVEINSIGKVYDILKHFIDNNVKKI